MSRSKAVAGGAAAKKAVAGKSAAKSAAPAKAASSVAPKRVLSKAAAAKPTVGKPAAAKSAAAKPASTKSTAAKFTAAKSKAAKPAATKPAAAKPAAAKPAPAAFAPEPRIDAYIERAAPFAQPILRHLRAIVRAACPQVEEAIKWGMPGFVYRGKLMCAMAAFKQHASFSFWQGANVVGAAQSAGSDAMGQFGRIGAIADLPGKRELTALVKQAMALIDDGIARPPTKTAQPRPAPVAPADLTAALAANAAARAAYDAFPPSQQREYVEWVETAKREETRRARVAQAVEWMAQGKARHWKYMAK